MCCSPYPPFCIQQDSILAVPVLHYTMEMAAEVKRVFDAFQPDCVAVEMAQSKQELLLRAASRLPDISVVRTGTLEAPLYYLAEPCDAAFEGLRVALESGKSAFCIDLDVEGYPEYRESYPDAYAITHIGYAAYYDACVRQRAQRGLERSKLDRARECHMARCLKELSLRFDKVLFVGGIHHVQSVLDAMRLSQFPEAPPVRESLSDGLYTLTEDACREGMAESAWMTRRYEEWRQGPKKGPREEPGEGLPEQPLDRARLLYQLYDLSGTHYVQESGNPFPRYHLRNLMKFSRNYALIAGRLMPDLYRIVTAARGCVDSNYAYEVWKCATDYPFLRNVDNLEALSLSPEELWGASRVLKFRFKEPRRKGYDYANRKKKEGTYTFSVKSFICSYPPEDIVIENFGKHLKKRGMQLLLEEQMRIIPFSTSLEEGVDMRETIRHWQEEGKIYVRRQGRPVGQIGAMVVIFDPDAPVQESKGIQEKEYIERYPWKVTWIGEHMQESDMAFYATPMGERIIGPGISRCEYGGFLLSYPPRRLADVWLDEDYRMCKLKSELLLMCAVDYSQQPVILYVAQSPPPSRIKNFAARFGKKIFYIPLTQLSPPLLQKIRVFHVLDGRHRRDIAGEYIY